MTHNEFDRLVDELDSESLTTLKAKNAKYAPYEDALRNFHVGASIMGTNTAMCVWGYATKHMASLRDRVQYNNWNDLDDVKEKIQDTINYLRFLWCVANEENGIETNKNGNFDTEDDYDEDYFDCLDCKYDYLIHDDKNWADGKNTMIVEPCASCKGNFCQGTEEYENHNLNFVPKDEVRH